MSDASSVVNQSDAVKSSTGAAGVYQNLGPETSINPSQKVDGVSIAATTAAANRQ